MSATPPPSSGGLKLPFDLRTALISLIGNWWLFLCFLAAAVFLAYEGGHRFGSATYKAHTTLLYTKISGTHLEIAESSFLKTHLDMVKMHDNLAALREELGLEVELTTLASSIDASILKDTGLLAFSATWDHGPTAAAVANGIRDIFLQHHVRLIAAGEERALEAQRKDLSKTVQSLELQLSQLSSLEFKIRSRMDQEREVNPETEGLGDINIRIERLRDAIYDDQVYRSNLAELARLEVELERANRLVSEGLMAPQEADRARAEFLAQKAKTLDTEQTSEWRGELERLQAVAMPAESATSPSAPVLQEMLLREFGMQLELIKQRESLLHVDTRLDQVHKALADLSVAIHDEDLGLNFFRTISTAETPNLPESSSKKLIAIAIAVLMTGFGAFVVLLRALMDRRVLSIPDAKAKLGIRALVGWRKGRLRHARKDLNEDFLLLSSRLAQGETPSIMLMTIGEERWLARATAHLAQGMTRLEKRVTLIDVSGEEKIAKQLAREVLEEPLPIQVQDVLNETHPFESALQDRTPESGLAVLRAREGLRPDQLLGSAFQRMLKTAKQHSDVVLVIGPDPSKTQQSALIADRCDRTLLVLRASRFRAGRLKRALRPLLTQSEERLGVVLGEIRRPYAKLEDAA